MEKFNRNALILFWVTVTAIEHMFSSPYFQLNSIYILLFILLFYEKVAAIGNISRTCQMSVL